MALLISSLPILLLLTSSLLISSCSRFQSDTAIDATDGEDETAMVSDTAEDVATIDADGPAPEGTAADEPEQLNVEVEGSEQSAPDAADPAQGEAAAPPLTDDDPSEPAEPSEVGASGGGDGLMGGGADGMVVPGILSANGQGLQGDDLKSYLADRFEAFWAVYDEARANPGTDPMTDHAALAELAAGEQLAEAVAGVDVMRDEGEVLRESDSPAIDGTDTDSEHRVSVDLIGDGMAEINACVVNDDLTVDAASGAVKSSDVVTVRSVSTMVRTDGTWRIIRSRATEVTDGVGGCWDEPASTYPY